jgi:hypothetical protein
VQHARRLAPGGRERRASWPKILDLFRHNLPDVLDLAFGDPRPETLKTTWAIRAPSLAAPVVSAAAACGPISRTVESRIPAGGANLP